MSRAALAAHGQEHYRTARVAWDGEVLAYADRALVQTGLHDWERTALERHLRAGDRVVVTSAGSGRELLWLLERGFDAVGFDPSAELVAAGERVLADMGHSGRLRASPPDLFPSGPGPCEFVLVGWGGHMHVAGRSRRVAFLRAAAAALSPGGRLMLSYWDRDDVRGLATTYRIARWVRRVRRDEPPELGDTLAPSFLHRFSHEEIRSELAEAGFRVVYSQPEPVCHVVGVAG